VLKIRSIYMGALVLFFLGIASISLAFYLPLYFQATQGVSATHSGVNMIAYVAPSIVAIGITGALVTKWGFYVPYMVVGIAIATIASGFLIRLNAYTSTVEWAALLVVNRLGMGMAQQLPYTALQAVLEYVPAPVINVSMHVQNLLTRGSRPEDIATGNAIAIFSWQLGGSIAVSVSQNLFLQTLHTSIPARTSAVNVQAVIDAGAGGLAALAPNLGVLQNLREAYADALRGTWVLAAVGTGLALPCAVGMQWLNIKRIAEGRKTKATDSGGEEGGVVEHATVRETKAH
jgi:hypothetical protein